MSLQRGAVGGCHGHGGDAAESDRVTAGPSHLPLPPLTVPLPPSRGSPSCWSRGLGLACPRRPSISPGPHPVRPSLSYSPRGLHPCPAPPEALSCRSQLLHPCAGGRGAEPQPPQLCNGQNRQIVTGRAECGAKWPSAWLWSRDPGLRLSSAAGPQRLGLLTCKMGSITVPSSEVVAGTHSEYFLKPLEHCRPRGGPRREDGRKAWGPARHHPRA